MGTVEGARNNHCGNCSGSRADTRRRTYHPLTPAEFSAALVMLGWSERYLARQLQCDKKMVQRWSAGDAPIPQSLAMWLVKLSVYHEMLPPPDDWRVYTYE